jgi:hypothetical protein
MALLCLSQSLGYITWVNIDRKNDWYKFMTAAILMAFIIIGDITLFHFYPSELNIFVEDSRYAYRQREEFYQMAQNLKVARHKGESVFDLKRKISGSEQRPVPAVSFSYPFKSTKLTKILMAGGLRCASTSLCI